MLPDYCHVSRWLNFVMLQRKAVHFLVNARNSDRPSLIIQISDLTRNVTDKWGTFFYNTLLLPCFLWPWHMNCYFCKYWEQLIPLWAADILIYNWLFASCSYTCIYGYNVCHRPSWGLGTYLTCTQTSMYVSQISHYHNLEGICCNTLTYWCGGNALHSMETYLHQPPTEVSVNINYFNLLAYQPHSQGNVLYQLVHMYARPFSILQLCS